MFKKKQTKLIVENWRNFLKEGESSSLPPVKICQALMTKEGSENFANKFSIDGINSEKTFKSAKQIFQVSKVIVNTLIIGPITIKDYKTKEVESDTYFMMFFRDDQGSNNEHVYPQKLANWIQHNGSISEINITDINQLCNYAQQKSIDTKRVIKTNQDSNQELYSFCKNATAGSAQKIDGVIVFKPINGQIKTATAYPTDNKALSNASVYS